MINLIGFFLFIKSLDHKILLFKLDAYGIRGLVNRWFKSYLSNRKQYVEINYTENTSRISEKFTSTLKETKSGAPQGLVLGLVLFMLYINDIPINIQGGRTTLFADDTNIQIEATDANILNKKVKEIMHQLSSWFYLNKLVINTDKTIAISFYA